VKCPCRAHRKVFTSCQTLTESRGKIANKKKTQNGPKRRGAMGHCDSVKTDYAHAGQGHRIAIEGRKLLYCDQREKGQVATDELVATGPLHEMRIGKPP